MANRRNVGSVNSPLWGVRSEKSEPRATSFKFRNMRIESPDISVLSDFSDQHDLVSRSNYDTPAQTPKIKFSLEECSYSVDRDIDGSKALERVESKKVNVSQMKKIPIASIDELKEEPGGTKIFVGSISDTPVASASKKPSIKRALTQFLKKDDDKGSRHLVADDIQKKQTIQDRTKFKSNRLLRIIANQAVYGKDLEVAKILKAALTKVNREALGKAQIDALKKKKRFKRFFRSTRAITSILIGPWKPDSRFIVYWKVILLLAILVQAFISTFILAFLDNSEDTLDNKFVVIDFVVDVIYVFSIAFRFRTAFYHQGELKTKSSEIVLNYLKGGFIIDIISEFSLIGRASPTAHSKYLILLTLLKIFQIPGLLAAIEDHFQFSRLVRTVVEVFKLCFAILILAHWFGCLLYSITRTEVEKESWLSEAGLLNAGIVDVYTASLYWAITTMSTVGYGDISPKTTRERVLTIVIMILSSIVFGYLLSSIGSLLFDLTTFSSESREKIRLLNKYMKEKGLSKDIQSKIRKYLQFYLDKENSVPTDTILQLLSQTLKDEIIKEVNARILNENEIFSSNFRNKFLNLISREFTEKTFGPDDIVFQHNESKNLSAYFITSGRVEIFYEKSDTILQKLYKGSSFGLFAFFSGEPRTASVRSLEFTNCFVLDREKFFEKLEEYPSEKEMYLMIKESITLQESYQFFNITCYSCKIRGHIALYCPKVHYKPDRRKIISNFLLNEKFHRRHYERKPRKRFHARKNFEALQEAAAQHQMVQQNELYFDENEDDETVEVRSYSSTDDILERNIYDKQPIVYVADSIHFKAFAMHDEQPESSSLIHNTSTPSIAVVTKKQKKKKKAPNPEGEIENFVRLNYDKYYHNLNLDKVKNFEVYNPSNNVNRLVLDFDQSRVQRGVEGRLGMKSRYLSRYLIKGFKMNEQKTPKVAQYVEPVDKKKAIQDERRKSVMPADIMAYSTKLRNTFGKKGDESSRYDSDGQINKMATHQSIKMRKPQKTKLSSTDIVKGSSKEGTPTRSRQISAVNPARKDETGPSRTSSSSSNSSDSNTSSSGSNSASEQQSTPRPTFIKNLRPSPEEKLLTANFGELTTTHKNRVSDVYNNPTLFPSKSAAPMTPNYRDDRGKSLFSSEQTIAKTDQEDNENKKPVALFDFSSLLKRMTGKLEENSKASYGSVMSGSNKIEKNVLTYKSTVSPLKAHVKKKKDLLLAILHQKKKNSGIKKKGRSSSVGDGKDIANIIQKYGLEEVMKGK